MVDALEHFFMMAHNLLVAPDSTQAPVADTTVATAGQNVKDAEDLVAWLKTLVNVLDAGGQAVAWILPVSEVDLVDGDATDIFAPRDPTDDLETENLVDDAVQEAVEGSTAAAAAADAVSVIDSVGTVEEGGPLVPAQQELVEHLQTGGEATASTETEVGTDDIAVATNYATDTPMHSDNGADAHYDHSEETDTNHTTDH